MTEQPTLNRYYFDAGEQHSTYRICPELPSVAEDFHCCAVVVASTRGKAKYIFCRHFGFDWTEKIASQAWGVAPAGYEEGYISDGMTERDADLWFARGYDFEGASGND